MPKLNKREQVETGIMLSIQEKEIILANLRFALENCPLEGGILIEDGTTSSEQSVRTLLKKLEAPGGRQLNLAELGDNEIKLLKAINEYAVNECPIDSAMMLNSGRMITKDDLRELKSKFSELAKTAVTKGRALSPIESLEEEHRLISKVVKLLPKVRQNIESGVVDEHILTDIVEFFSKFTDEFHHAKEEDKLFSALQQRGVSSKGCPVGALTLEHQQGRTLTNSLKEAITRYREGDAAAAKTISELLRTAEELYAGHIWKEDYLLFPMSTKVLSSQDLGELAKDFGTIQAKFGSSFLERYSSIVKRLEKNVEQASAKVVITRASIVHS